MVRLSLCLVILAAAAVQAEEGVALPMGFDGIYVAEGMPCGAGERITVRDGTITGEEWGMTVTDLVEFPGEPDKVEATLLVSGGGGEWTESAVLTLSVTESDTALVWDYPDGTRNIWTRCEDLP